MGTELTFPLVFEKGRYTWDIRNEPTGLLGMARRAGSGRAVLKFPLA
jgi:hypothetical protein